MEMCNLFTIFVTKGKTVNLMMGGEIFLRESLESVEAKTTRHVGDNVENDNGGPSDAINTSP